MAAHNLELHHRVPRCLLRLHDLAVNGELDGVAIQLWMEYEWECQRWGSPLAISMVNEQNVEGLASPTDVVGNIKSGKRASQKRGDPRSHERCKSNSELVEGEGPFYRAKPHQG